MWKPDRRQESYAEIGQGVRNLSARGGDEDGGKGKEYQTEKNTIKKPGTNPDEALKPFDGRIFQEIPAQGERIFRESRQGD